MASYNKVLLMGNLTRDPVLKFLPSQTQVVEFAIACNRKFKGANGEDREEVTFVEITAFAKTAELINQYFTKGKPIFIEGRLKLDQWEDKNGGGKRSKLSVVCENFQFIGGRDGGAPGEVMTGVALKAVVNTINALRHDRRQRQGRRHNDHRPGPHLPISRRRNNPSATNRKLTRRIFLFNRSFVSCLTCAVLHRN